MKLTAAHARLSMHAQDDVLMVSVTGLVTVKALEEIRRHIAPAANQGGAVWFDYRRSAIAVTDLELQSLVTPIARGTRSIPMAWVVADASVAELWARQTLRLALAGHRRYVACDPAAAMRWAKEQAMLALPTPR